MATMLPILPSRSLSPECLQVDIDAQSKVFARHGATVEPAVHVTALYPSVGIAQQNLHTLFPTQLLLIILLHALLADVIAKLVIRIALYV